MEQEIFKQIERAKKIAIFTHQRPDGDAFGSTILLHEFLKVNYPEKKTYVYLMNYESDLVFDKMLEEVEINVEEVNFDLAVALDCANLDRFLDYEELFTSAKYTINIDHHQDNTRFAKLNCVEEISSCSQLLFNILLSSGKTINKRMASVACAGIITDTNSFTTPNVTKDTFNTVAKMFELGADVIKIRQQFYSGNENNIFKLIGRAITKAEFYYNDNLMFIDLNQQDFEDCGVEKDTGCLINQIFSISKAKCCFLVTPRDNINHISMRCAQGLNINETAKKLGGGGHICASATNTDMDVETIRTFILKDMEGQLVNYVAPNEDLFD